MNIAAELYDTRAHRHKALSRSQHPLTFDGSQEIDLDRRQANRALGVSLIDALRDQSDSRASVLLGLRDDGIAQKVSRLRRRFGGDDIRWVAPHECGIACDERGEECGNGNPAPAHVRR